MENNLDKKATFANLCFVSEQMNNLYPQVLQIYHLLVNLTCVDETALQNDRMVEKVYK